MTPAKTVFLLALATLMALVLVRQAARHRRVGYRLNDLQSDISDEMVLRERYRTDVSTLRNPARLMALVERYGLELRPAAPEPATDTPVDSADTLAPDTAIDSILAPREGP
jgi:hypothetical protein